MNTNEMSSWDLYKLGYDEHYEYKRYEVAYAIYNKVIELFPDSNEANFAKQEITSLPRNTVPDYKEAAISIDEMRESKSFVSTKNQKHTANHENGRVGVMYGESNWAKGLRTAVWISFVSNIIASFVLAYQAGGMFADWGQDIHWGFFFIVLIVSLLSTFLVTAVIMVFLDMADDISVTRQTNYEMLRLLQQGGGASSVSTGHESASKPTLSSVAAKTSPVAGDFWHCSGCGDKNSSSARYCKGCGKEKTVKVR